MPMWGSSPQVAANEKSNPFMLKVLFSLLCHKHPQTPQVTASPLPQQHCTIEKVVVVQPFLYIFTSIAPIYISSAPQPSGCHFHVRSAFIFPKNYSCH